MMTFSIARFHDTTHLIISCDEDNYPSKSVIEKLGGIHIEAITPPNNYVFYYDGIPEKSIYRININADND